MRGQIDPAGYGKKKKEPYRHGSRRDNQGRYSGNVCGAAWYEVAEILGQMMGRWRKTGSGEEYIAIEEANALNGYTLEDEWANVQRTIDWAREHCDLTYDFGYNQCLENAFNNVYQNWKDTVNYPEATIGLDTVEAMELGREFFSALGECMIGETK